MFEIKINKFEKSGIKSKWKIVSRSGWERNDWSLLNFFFHIFLIFGEEISFWFYSWFFNFFYLYFKHLLIEIILLLFLRLSDRLQLPLMSSSWRPGHKKWKHCRIRVGIWDDRSVLWWCVVSCLKVNVTYSTVDWWRI